MILKSNFLDIRTSRPVSEVISELKKIIDSDVHAHTGSAISRSTFFLSGLGQKPYAGQIDESGFRFSYKLAILGSLLLPTAFYQGSFVELPDGKLQVKVVMKTPPHLLLRLLPIQILVLFVILRNWNHWPVFTAMSKDHRVLITAAILIIGAFSGIAGLYRHSIKVYNDLEFVLLK